ncbi:MAG: magnesium transporter, partial [Firmicutes bacterium]|nr:magnesium transporter [Bacillota bacterium]MBR6025505.1 magnesium transporter [Bacillota bacterium]
MAENNVMQSTLGALLESKKYSAIKDILVTMNPSDVAEILSEVDETQLPRLFRLLPKEEAAEAFVEMDSDLQELLINAFSAKELHEVINELYVDDAADLVDEMPANVVKRILAASDPQMRKEINEILKYPENSAGAVMTTEYIALRPGMTVREAIEKIKRVGVDSETIYTNYVTDYQKHLIGFVSAKQLLLAKDDSETIESLMQENVISVQTDTDQEDVAQMISKYNFLAIPVVDKENRMVGIVTYDDAMEIIEEEATEDIEIMAGMSPSDVNTTYLKTPVKDLFKQRIPWLSFLMLSATFTGIILTIFENKLAACVALTTFIPMLMDTGGNSGTQSSVTVIRALSLDELEPSDVIYVIWKEIRTAVLCGVTLAALCFVKIWVIDIGLMHHEEISLTVAFVVCITMAFTVLVAKCIGCIMPFVATKLGLDPAVMASPFISTLVDAASLLIYFGVATVLLFNQPF